MGKVLIIKGADFSAIAVGKVDIAVEIPQIQIDPSTKQVTLSATSGLDIYYTVDGSAPSRSSTKYTTPFTVGDTTTIKAISTNGTLNSSVPKITATSNIAVNGSVTIELASSVSGTIRYTTNGSAPSATSSAYSSAIAVSAGQTIKAAVYSGTTLVSEVASIEITS